jgi:hypothetical protein
MHIKFWSKNLKGSDDFEDLAIASKKIIIQPWKFLTLNSYTGMIHQISLTLCISQNIIKQKCIS